jgi:hypothetical protein
MVFCNPHAEKRPKTRQKNLGGNLQKNGVFLTLDFTIFVCGVFELPLLRSAQKQDKKSRGKHREEKKGYGRTFFSGFLQDTRRFLGFIT